MDRLLIIADDFTGALDTGIQFTKLGLRTRIITDYSYDFEKSSVRDSLLSVNTDSRPLSPQEAFDRVYTLASNAMKAGFTNIYKKTDSGLRGNIGMELKAVMDACGQNMIAFIPAFPLLNRITRDGIQYIDNVPVAESVFGKDPFESVHYSDIAQIIHEQTDLKVRKVRRGAYESVSFRVEEPTVLLFDAETDDDLVRIAKVLKEKDAMRVVAGCAGFAAAYQKMLTLEKGRLHSMQPSGGLLALCGSVNAITVRQLQAAQEYGFARSHLTNAQKLCNFGDSPEEEKAFFDNLFDKVCASDKYILDSLDQPGSLPVSTYANQVGLNLSDIRFKIAASFGRIAREMVERGLGYTLSMTGGDTLMGFMNCIGMTELVPVCEIGKGAVLSILTWEGKRIQVISKSGGFGEEDIFLRMYDKVMHPDLHP